MFIFWNTYHCKSNIFRSQYYSYNLNGSSRNLTSSHTTRDTFMKSLLHVELLSQDARKNKDRRRTSRWDTDLNIDFRRMFAPWLRLRGFSLFSEASGSDHTSSLRRIRRTRKLFEKLLSFKRNGQIRDVDKSRKPGKLPGCERDFSGCEALLLSPKCF